MSSVPAVGIDLGTTFSCVSVYRNGRPELVPNTEGDRLTPSIVFYSPRTGEVSVGETADQLLPQCPKNGLLDAKRFIGRKYDDEFISRYKNSNQVHFSLVRDDDGQAAFEIDVSDKKIIKKPEEVSAEVLKYLKDITTEYLGETVTKAVISVPAYFSNAQRKATKAAAELAGFTVLKLITEPTAAAIHYVSDKKRINSNILAFDFGGGTLDVSLIKIKNNIFEVKSVYGDTLLGGRNFDDILFEHFFKQFSGKNNVNFASRKFKRRLSSMCSLLKKKLSSKDEFTLFIDRYDGNSDLNLHMTRADFEKMGKDIFDRVMEVVELCIHDSGLAKSDISEVILVGGTTRIPKMRELLSCYFDAEKIKTDLNPDEAVAAGASIHAACLLEDRKDLEKYKVTDITPMSLGTCGSHMLMKFFIPKNSSLPITVSHTLETTYNDQTTVNFPVYEGERRNANYNNKLGEFSVTNLPLKRAGDVKFTVSFNLNDDGILNVTATETTTHRENNLVVTMGQFRLSERKIKDSLQDARKHKTEDDIFEKFVYCKRKLIRRCRYLLYEIEKISIEDERSLVTKNCNEFLDSCKALEFTEIAKMEETFARCKDSVSDVLKKHSMLHLLLD